MRFQWSSAAGSKTMNMRSIGFSWVNKTPNDEKKIKLPQCWSYIKRSLLTRNSGWLTSTLSTTLNASMTVLSSFHGLSMIAFSQYFTQPCFPSNVVGRLFSGRRNSNGKEYSPALRTGLGPICPGARGIKTNKALLHMRFKTLLDKIIQLRFHFKSILQNQLKQRSRVRFGEIFPL